MSIGLSCKELLALFIQRLVGLFLFSFFLLNQTAANEPVIQLGVINTVAPLISHSYFDKSIEAIQEAIAPDKLEVKFYTPNQFLEAVKAGDVDLGLASSGMTSVMMDDTGGTLLLSTVTTRSPNPNRGIGAAIVVRNDNTEINNLQDLKDKTIGVISKQAFASYIVPMAEVRANGLRPSKLFKNVVEVGNSSSELLQKLKNKEFDAAFVVTCVMENLAREGKLNPYDFKVINRKNSKDFYCEHSTNLYPSWILSASSTVPAHVARRIVENLLKLPAGEPSGIQWTVATDFREMKALLTQMNLRLSGRAYVEYLLKEYRWYFFAFGLLLAGIVLNMVYLGYAVRKKTEEMKKVLAENLKNELEIQKYQVRIDSLQKASAIGLLSSMVAHELKQPLAVIVNYAEGIIRRINRGGSLDQQVLAEAITEIKDEGTRAADIVDLVRDYGRNTPRKRDLFNVSELVRSVVSMLEKTGRLTIPCELDLQDNAFTKADRLDIELVLINLIKNAKEACQSTENPKIVVRVKQSDPSVYLSVEDNGPSLTDAQIEKLSNVGESTKKNGLGLGLAIVRQLLEVHAGSLTIERKKTCGLICTVKLPQANPENIEQWKTN